MNIKSKYGKVIKALSIRQSDLWLVPRLMTPLENSFQTEAIDDEEVCIVPKEANFQLPNVFLRTGQNPEYQKLVDGGMPSSDWDDVIEETIEMLEEIDLSIGSGGVMTRKCPVDQGILNRLVFERYGYS
ncbi:hypothetical protein [Encephalitozoon cuniculi GB-M1]|uniref:Uncharacterized protein n=2 Tax=Encephalitozoon cuniculi TaxID=6035 RepID=Q8SV29_ENCCU|nr:uncharacterized protein ECU07_0470 [Encephalitozoon cuniculi GB-M1]AGE96386.1 hypothetical protein ECU07_0470 [Encephalitozoon cuniculi]KMV65771.1 hypothetical protein M970_070420 [Encephalitozoon cuniculi EcunIII-L]UYI27205.1 DUF5100 domain-containing protein [Encephalitozoon cuniculi]CAD25579.1 hypothetical protein [Encephalitozoon cuniculi GB-M1]